MKEFTLPFLREISKIEIIHNDNDNNDEIILYYDDEILKICDEQQCCEDRYITTSENLKEFIDFIFLGIEIRTSNIIENEEHVHEVAFLYVKTNKGDIVFETHNIHNGYYEGFNIYFIGEDIL